MDAILRSGWTDLADLLVISFFVHRLFLLFRWTSSLQILVGLVTLRLLLVLAHRAELVWTSQFLNEVNAWVPILIIVVFRNEIREALLQTSPIRLLVSQPNRLRAIDLPAVTEAVFRLAGARTGALLVFPNRDRLGEHVREGVALGGRLSTPILESLFAKESPVHDGAAVIRHGRIERVGAFLPLTRQNGLPAEFGTRHRAAIGLSEVCDAVVVVVSEERGEVSVAHRGTVLPIEGPASLERVLRQRLRGEAEGRKNRRWVRDLAGQAAGFLLSFVLVSAVVLWGLQSSGPVSLKTVAVPIDYRNLADRLQLQSATTEQVEIQVRGPRPLITSLTPTEVAAFVNLTDLPAGRHRVPLGASNVTVPPGLEVIRVSPASLWVDIENRIERTVKVRPQLVGRPLESVEYTVRPATVTVWGPRSAFDDLDSLSTEPIDIRDLKPGDPPRVFNAALILSPASVRLAEGQGKQIQVVVRLRPTP
ncbi:MAG TPA: diadenylate cyclase [Isosphaeraceae bacterium]